jgi:methylaspartate mutase sigma subunit
MKQLALTGESFPVGRRGGIVLGVAASDAHVVANHLIAMYLRRLGFAVVNLGACTPTEDFMRAASHCDELVAVVIGSLNGHALDDLADLPQLKSQYGVTAPIVVGGNLSVGAIKSDEVFEKLTALGVDSILAHPSQLVGALRSMGWSDPALMPISNQAAVPRAFQKVLQDV